MKMDKLTLPLLSSRIDLSNISPALQTSSQLTSQLRDVLSGCPSDYYLFVAHPSVSLTDFENQDVTPYLNQLLSTDESGTGIAKSSVVVRDVYGDVDTDALVSDLSRSCGSDVVRVNNNGEYIVYKL